MEYAKKDWRDVNIVYVGLYYWFVDHIDYIKNRIGADFVGIGADYDGTNKLVLLCFTLNI